MKFDADFIEKVRDANNIVDVISEFTQLKGASGRLMGLCPFPGHKEKTPSFSVSSDKQVYYCFGCKKAGNIYTFVQEMKGLSFPESVEYLAQRASIPMPKEVIDHKGQKKPLATGQKDRAQARVMWKVNEFAAQFYHQQLLRLPSSHPMRIYCRDRGLDQNLIEKFQIGAALEDWDGLARALEKAKAPLAVAEKLGLIRRRPQGGQGHYDLYRSRLMFPIISPTGNCVGFGGRIVGEGQPKYLNSSESDIFNKGRLFYGLNETAKFIREADQAILVEGYMDFLALYQAGFTNVVATLGTALTPAHARLLSRYTRNILVLFDGDNAGWTAAERSLPILLAEGLVPKHFLIPNNKDPDDYVRSEGADAFRQAMAHAPELFHTVLQRIFTNYHGQPGEKVVIIDALQPVLGAMKDARLKQLYVEELADRLQVESGWLVGALRQVKDIKGKADMVAGKASPEAQQPLTESAPQPVKEEGGLITIRKPPQAELYLLNLALLREENMKFLIKEGAVDQFMHSGVKEIFSRAIEAYRQMPNEFDKLTALLASQVEPPAMVSLHLEKAWAEMDVEGEKKLISDCLKKVREGFLRAKARGEMAFLRGQSPSEQLKKLEQIVNIHSDRRNLQKDNN